MKKFRCANSALEKVLARVSLPDGRPDAERIHGIMRELGLRNQGKGALRFRAFIEEGDLLPQEEKFWELLGLSEEDAVILAAELEEERRKAFVRECMYHYREYLRFAEYQQRQYRPYVQIRCEKKPLDGAQPWTRHAYAQMTSLHPERLTDGGCGAQDLRTIQELILDWRQRMIAVHGNVDAVPGLGRIHTFAYYPKLNLAEILFDPAGNVIYNPKSEESRSGVPRYWYEGALCIQVGNQPVLMFSPANQNG